MAPNNELRWPIGFMSDSQTLFELKPSVLICTKAEEKINFAGKLMKPLQKGTELAEI
jgi:hypothetical protein